MAAYTKPQQERKGESKRVRGEGDQTKLIDLRFERWQIVEFRNFTQNFPRIIRNRQKQPTAKVNGLTSGSMNEPIHQFIKPITGQ